MISSCHCNNTPIEYALGGPGTPSVVPKSTWTRRSCRRGSVCRQAARGQGAELPGFVEPPEVAEPLLRVSRSHRGSRSLWAERCGATVPSVAVPPGVEEPSSMVAEPLCHRSQSRRARGRGAAVPRVGEPPCRRSQSRCAGSCGAARCSGTVG